MSDQPIVQWDNQAKVSIDRTYFIDRNESNYAWQGAISSILALPALRAFWPMSSVDYATASRARDIAAGAYHLGDNNTVLFGYDQLAPYAEFDGVNQYLSRADGGAANWADIRGTEAYVVAAQRGLTLGGWFYFDNAAGATEGMMAKDAGVPQRAYFMSRQAGGAIRWLVSVDGTANIFIDSTQTPAQSTWFFSVARFVPSTSLDIFVNANKTSNVAAVPASIFDSTTQFTVGSRGSPANYMAGRASLCFLCAAALSDSLVSALYHQTRKLYNV